MADLHWDKAKAIERGAMGILRWHDHDHQRFEVIDADWLSEYNAQTWRSIE